MPLFLSKFFSLDPGKADSMCFPTCLARTSPLSVVPHFSPIAYLDFMAKGRLCKPASTKGQNEEVTELRTTAMFANSFLAQRRNLLEAAH